MDLDEACVLPAEEPIPVNEIVFLHIQENPFVSDLFIAKSLVSEVSQNKLVACSAERSRWHGAGRIRPMKVKLQLPNKDKLTKFKQSKELIKRKKEMIVHMTTNRKWAKSGLKIVTSVKPGASDLKMDVTSEEGRPTGLPYEKLLGTGSFGFVFQKNSLTTKSTAVKICFLESFAASAMEQRTEKKWLLQEFELMKAAKHENLLNVLSCREMELTAWDISKILENCLMEDSEVQRCFAVFLSRAIRLKSLPTICIEMELCGKNLRQWINSHTLDDVSIKSKQVHIIQDLMAGLGYIHERNILHRDLRPENIMFSYSLSGFEFPIKISDFGLTRNLEQNMTGSRFWMVEYRAPEVGIGHYTEKADLFSLGLIMWEVLEMMKGSQKRRMFQKLVYDNDPDVVRECNFILNAKKVIEKLTQVKPEKRFESVLNIELLIKMK